MRFANISIANSASPPSRDLAMERFTFKSWRTCAAPTFSSCNPRARPFSKRLKADLVMVNKRRIEGNVAQVMNVIGDVKGRNCLVVDDIIDTAGTLVKNVEALLKAGATKVYACCTHPVLSGPAVDRIQSSDLIEVVVTNTIPLHAEARKCKKI